MPSKRPLLLYGSGFLLYCYNNITNISNKRLYLLLYMTNIMNNFLNIVYKVDIDFNIIKKLRPSFQSGLAENPIRTQKPTPCQRTCNLWPSKQYSILFFFASSTPHSTHKNLRIEFLYAPFIHIKKQKAAPTHRP